MNPAVPAVVSEIVMHLLEKEPDNRYQTADGLAHDLEQLRDGGAGRGWREPPDRRVEIFRCGCCHPHGWWDAPRRWRHCGGRSKRHWLAGVGAYSSAVRREWARRRLPMGSGRVVSQGGWFITGKFDQHRRDLEFDAVQQVLRAVGRMLLAEPERELAQVRARISAAGGSNAGLLAATVPEFAALLGVPPDPGDPLTAQVRASERRWRCCARSPRRNGRSSCSSMTCSGLGGPRWASSIWY